MYLCSHFTLLKWFPLLLYWSSGRCILANSDNCLKFEDEVDNSAFDSLLNLLSRVEKKEINQTLVKNSDSPWEPKAPTDCTIFYSCYKVCLVNLSFPKAWEKHFWLNAKPKHSLADNTEHAEKAAMFYGYWCVFHKYSVGGVRAEKQFSGWIQEISENTMSIGSLRYYECWSTHLKSSASQVSFRRLIELSIFLAEKSYLTGHGIKNSRLHSTTLPSSR